jgi:serine/threonine-protein kinase
MYGAEFSAQQRVGTTLHGKYHLEQLIGVGGMAAVYRGSHRNGNRVAVKVLHSSVSNHADLRERFLREGYVANRVQHRGAVRVLDDDIAEDGTVFLVMELLEGHTLDARWERAGRQLPPREVAELAHQLLDVLAAAHDKGIVHRDIKPENLFLTGDGILKVLDFGIARLRDTGVGMASATRTGSMLGTPAYMPPEQALGRNREIDAQSDVWAIGATMFALISGRYVHDAESVAEMVVYAGSRPARLLASVAPYTPHALAAVVDHALSFDKAARWPSARAMQTGLEAAYATSFGGSLASGRSTGASGSSAAAPTVEVVLRMPPTAAQTASPPTLQPTTTAPIAPSTTQPVPSISTTGGVESHPAPVANSARSRKGLRLAIGASAALVLGTSGVLVSLRRGAAPVPSERAAEVLPMSAALEIPKVPTAHTSTAGPSISTDRPAGVEAGATQANRPAYAPTSVPRLTLTASAGSIDETQRALNDVLSGLRTAKSVATALAPVSTPPMPNCHPPYTIDGAGRRIPKPECL